MKTRDRNGAAVRTGEEEHGAHGVEQSRRHELAVSTYEDIAGPGSWQQHEMVVTAWQFGGNAPWENMTDAAIIDWAENFARIDLDLDQEIARERAEMEEH